MIKNLAVLLFTLSIFLIADTSFSQTAQTWQIPFKAWMADGTYGNIYITPAVSFKGLADLAKLAETDTNIGGGGIHSVQLIGLEYPGVNNAFDVVYYYETYFGSAVSSEGLPWNYLSSQFGNYAGKLYAYQNLTCPTGYTMIERGQCFNSTTQTCNCPVGEKFKNAASMCVSFEGVPPAPNPDDDNGPNCPDGDGEPRQPVCGNPINPGSGN